MNRTSLRTALAFLLPPLESRVRDMVVDVRTQATSDLTFDFAQLSQHRLLSLWRVKPREISSRGKHWRRVARTRRARRPCRVTRGRCARGRLPATGNMRAAGAQRTSCLIKAARPVRIVRIMSRGAAVRNASASRVIGVGGIADATRLFGTGWTAHATRVAITARRLGWLPVTHWARHPRQASHSQAGRCPHPRSR
jgi:hypothetical protein